MRNCILLCVELSKPTKAIGLYYWLLSSFLERKILLNKFLFFSDHEEFINATVLSVTVDPPIPEPFQEPFEFVLNNKEVELLLFLFLKPDYH